MVREIIQSVLEQGQSLWSVYQYHQNEPQKIVLLSELLLRTRVILRSAR
jgi:hypothetical protein